MGASLLKLASRRPDRSLHFELLSVEDVERVARELAALRPERIGTTGGGAQRLARLLDLDTASFGEFEAWGVGARALLERQGEAAAGPFLLVSLGTGTSLLVVDGERAERIGGTALGGGTLLGLGAALTGRTAFEELVALAAAGDRGRVDLLVSDVYPEGLPGLPGAASAASFGKLAGAAAPAQHGSPSDLAGALVGLVGENVALLCCALAAQAGVRRIVFGGATLRRNPALARWLVALTTAMGREPVLLEGGEYTGALGALLLAER